MPSSELSRIHLRCWTRLASRLESLLLGMLNACAKSVDSQFIKLAQTRGLYSQYTGIDNYLTSQSFFVHGLCSVVEQFLDTNKQPGRSIFNLLNTNLYTLSTVPTNTINLYKGFYL